MTDPKMICVFCGAQEAVAEDFKEAGRTFGKMLAARDIAMIYGGGDCGIMGAVANSSLKNGGKVVGVFPMALKNIENEHGSLSEIVIVDGMHERKKIMFDRCDAIVVLPGGFGTMDEMFEVITWRQIRLHDKPIVIFNYNGYWDHLVTLMENIIISGFARPETRGYYKVVTTFEGIFEAVRG